MKSIFTKPVMEPPVPNAPQPKSRFHLILDHFNQAHWHMSEAARLLSTLTFDTQKGINFVDKFRRDITESIQDAGGSVIATDIEDQMKEFIPKNFVREDGPDVG